MQQLQKLSYNKNKAHYALLDYWVFQPQLEGSRSVVQNSLPSSGCTSHLHNLVNYINEQKARINNEYELRTIIKCANNCEIVLAIRARDRKEVIIKLMHNRSEFENEKEILKKLNGRCHTLKLSDSFSLFPVISCGALIFEKLECADTFIPNSISEIKIFLFHLLQAIEYCHDQHIMHRDIKRENIFFQRGEELNVFLGDFGFAIEVDPRDKFGVCDYVGSPTYMAPEICECIGEPYNEKVDIWSAGIVLGELLCELIEDCTILSIFHQLQDQHQDSALSKMETLSKIFANVPIESIDSMAFDLLCYMLEVDPQTRITASKALMHPFFDECR